MPPTVANKLINGNNSDLASYGLGSVAFTSPIHLFAVHNSDGGGFANQPALTLPSGVTSTLLHSSIYHTDGANIARRMSLFVLAGQATGTTTITFGGVAQTGCMWAIAIVNGGDQITPISGAAITAIAESTSVAVNMGTIDAGDSAYMAAYGRAQTVIDADDPWIDLANLTQGNPSMTLSTQYLEGNSDPTPTATPGTFTAWGAIAVKLKGAASSKLDRRAGGTFATKTIERRESGVFVVKSMDRRSGGVFA